MHPTVTTERLPLTPALQEHIHRNLNAAFGQSSDFVGAVQISVRDVNEQRGAEGILCLIHAVLIDGEMVITATSDQPFRAVTKACARARHALGRRLQRIRERRRRTVRN